jgi:hypothetical protein
MTVSRRMVSQGKKRCLVAAPRALDDEVPQVAFDHRVLRERRDVPFEERGILICLVG